MPFLEDVHAVVGHHAQLGVLDGDEVLFLERLTARDAVINYSRIAGRLPLHTSSSGPGAARLRPARPAGAGAGPAADSGSPAQAEHGRSGARGHGRGPPPGIRPAAGARARGGQPGSRGPCAAAGGGRRGAVGRCPHDGRAAHMCRSCWPRRAGSAREALASACHRGPPHLIVGAFRWGVRAGESQGHAPDVVSTRSRVVRMRSWPWPALITCAASLIRNWTSVSRADLTGST